MRNAITSSLMLYVLSNFQTFCMLLRSINYILAEHRGFQRKDSKERHSVSLHAIARLPCGKLQFHVELASIERDRCGEKVGRSMQQARRGKQLVQNFLVFLSIFHVSEFIQLSERVVRAQLVNEFLSTLFF